MRLRGGGRTPLEGKVEVYLDGEWGTVRDNGWGVEEAAVVCRQLGFAAVKFATPGGSFDPAPASVPVHLDRVECAGVEVGLWECDSVRVNRQHSRQHDRDAGVICAGECVHACTFEIITTTTPAIPYYTINPSYCWMPDLENQEWWVKNLF